MGEQVLVLRVVPDPHVLLQDAQLLQPPQRQANGLVSGQLDYNQRSSSIDIMFYKNIYLISVPPQKIDYLLTSILEYCIKVRLSAYNNIGLNVDCLYITFIYHV